jgi:glycopeptide antibiotics resistance protein
MVLPIEFLSLYTLANYTALASIVYYDIDDVVLHNGSGHLLTWIFTIHGVCMKWVHHG